jgi:hypothetical protein
MTRPSFEEKRRAAGYVTNPDGSVTSPWVPSPGTLKKHYLDRINWVPPLTEDDLGVDDPED